MLKRWIAKHFHGETLEEYANESDIRKELVYKMSVAL